MKKNIIKTLFQPVIRSHKVKAFTIAETLINILILSIISAMLYIFLTTMNKQFSLFERRKLATLDYQVFTGSFSTDMYNCNSIKFQDSEKKLELTYYNGDQVNYYFSNHTVKREMNREEAYFDVYLVDYTFETLENNPNYINYAQLKLKILTDTITRYYVKYYPLSEKKYNYLQ